MIERAPLYTGQWDMALLRGVPKFTENREGNISQIYFEGLPYHARPTRVFAYLARPDKEDRKQPAIVLMHGGGGTAFREWAQLWARRGYVALAMDLRGNGPDGNRLSDGGPGEGMGEMNAADDFRDFWVYHAVADGVRAVSLLSSLTEADPQRIGLTGISWGGFHTCTVASLDDRVKAAVPVYGCGFIHENNTAFAGIFKGMTSADQSRWVRTLEPSSYVSQCQAPMLFVNGATDQSYPVEANQKTASKVKDHQMCLFPVLKHDHPNGWAPGEIQLFIDQHINGGTPLPRVVSQARDGDTVRIAFSSQTVITKTELHYTMDMTPWSPQRKWQTLSARIDGSTATATFPQEAVACFMTLVDERNASISSELEILVP